MRNRKLYLASVASVALLGAGLADGMAAHAPPDQIIEIGPTSFIVDNNGTLRDVRVGGRQLVEQLHLAAACRDDSIQGDSRLWQHRHDVAQPGVTIRREPENGRVVVKRDGVLAYGGKSSDGTVAYAQRVIASIDGALDVHYDVQIIRKLNWGPKPVKVAVQIPTALAGGHLCTLDHAMPQLVPITWSEEDQVTGSFSSLQLSTPAGRTLDVVAGPDATGALSDARAWGDFPHLYIAIAKKAPWFEGAKPIEKGTKWEINFTVQLPVGAAPSAGAKPSDVLLSDDFSRDTLGNAWRPGRMAKSALDKYNRIEVDGSQRAEACIQHQALDLMHAGKPGSCSIRSVAHNLPCRCAIEYDFTLKADDSTGNTRHSMYLRSQSDPGTCVCLHVDTTKQWWFFEFKEHGKWQGEKLFYYPFPHSVPGHDITFHVRIESYGDGTLEAWLSGGGIPPTTMPVAVNSIRSWTPFQDGELFVVCSHRTQGTRCHSQWDNVRVSTLPPWPTINELYYRNALLIEFGHYRFAPQDSSIEISVRRSGDDEVVLKRDVKPLDPQDSKLLMDISDLPRAIYDITAILRDDRGKTIGTTTVNWTKVRDPDLKLEDMKVAIDENNNAVVDGKPFFPIGLYCVTAGGAKRWDPPQDLLAELQQAGFNTVQNYSHGSWSLTPPRFDEVIIPWLDAAEAHNLKVFFSIHGPESHVRRRRGGLRTLDDPLFGSYDAPRQVAWRLQKVMNHPAILCWYTADEPIGHGRAIEELRRQNRHIKLIDPHHPTVIATCPGGEHCGGYRKGCRGVDILATDHYPLFHGEPAHAWRRTALKGRRATAGLQPQWAIPQCYNRGERQMTDAEIRLETYLPIVHGAKGVIWWACYYCKENHPESWEATKRLAGELKRISPILLAEDAAETVEVEPPEAPIDTLLKRYAGKRYLLAVNHAPDPAGDVTFQLPQLRACRSYFADVEKTVKDGSSFTDDFDGYDVHLYELR